MPPAERDTSGEARISVDETITARQRKTLAIRERVADVALVAAGRAIRNVGKAQMTKARGTGPHGESWEPPPIGEAAAMCLLDENPLSSPPEEAIMPRKPDAKITTPTRCGFIWFSDACVGLALRREDHIRAAVLWSIARGWIQCCSFLSIGFASRCLTYTVLVNHMPFGLRTQ